MKLDRNELDKIAQSHNNNSTNNSFLGNVDNHNNNFHGNRRSSGCLLKFVAPAILLLTLIVGGFLVSNWNFIMTNWNLHVDMDFDRDLSYEIIDNIENYYITINGEKITVGMKLNEIPHLGLLPLDENLQPLETLETGRHGIRFYVKEVEILGVSRYYEKIEILNILLYNQNEEPIPIENALIIGFHIVNHELFEAINSEVAGQFTIEAMLGIDWKTTFPETIDILGRFTNYRTISLYGSAHFIFFTGEVGFIEIRFDWLTDNSIVEGVQFWFCPEAVLEHIENQY